MRRNAPCRIRTLLFAAVVAAPWLVSAQDIAPNYNLTRPSWSGSVTDVDVAPRLGLVSIGGVRLAASGGSGLSLQAGQHWFAGVGLGRSIDSEVLSVGGGYRFPAGQALSMQVTRQLGQDRLGLAVRYDWSTSYLRMSYDTRLGPLGNTDMLRFSAGVRF